MKATTTELTEISLFKTLGLDSLQQLQPHTQVQCYQRNEIIIHEGDRFPHKLHTVLRGKLLAKKVSPLGKETVLRQLPAGEMFAAPALFGDGIAPATVVALQDSQVLLIDKEALLKAIQTMPKIALEILGCFNQRLQEMHQTIHGLVSERAVIRLSRLIQYTAQRYGVESTPTGACLNTKLPYQQMARMVGITYEECVRLVKKELKMAIGYGRGGVVTIRDFAVLEALVASDGQ